MVGFIGAYEIHKRKFSTKFFNKESYKKRLLLIISGYATFTRYTYG